MLRWSSRTTIETGLSGLGIVDVGMGCGRWKDYGIDLHMGQSGISYRTGFLPGFPVLTPYRFNMGQTLLLNSFPKAPL